MDNLNNEIKTVELTDDDRGKINACLKRPAPVWDAIRDIVIPKFDSYLEQLETVCQTDNKVNSIKQHWEDVKNNENKKAEYIKTDEFDKELSKVLIAFAEKRGLDVSQLPPNIHNWHKNSTMKRNMLFKIAVGFGFTVDETRELMFSVLSDDEQIDFNNRLANEMIYLYALTHNIPYAAEPDKGESEPPLSVKKMLKEGQNFYLHRMFGDKYEDCYAVLSKMDKINIFDSYNMTMCAFWIAAISLNVDDEIDDQNSSKASQNSRMRRIDPVESVAELCYHFSIGDRELRDEKKPEWKDVQRSKADFIDMLNLFETLFSRGISKLNKSSKEYEVKSLMYNKMSDYISELKDYISKQSDDTLFSPLDIISPLKNSGLGEFEQKYIGEMIDHLLLEKLDRYNDIFWIESKNLDKARNASLVKNINDSPLNDSDYEYYKLIIESIRLSLRDLRAVTQRGKLDLFDVYYTMNEILKYPYFDDAGIGMEIYGYENYVSMKKEDSEHTSSMSKRFSLEHEAVKYNISDYKDYLNVLLNGEDIQCYEQYDRVRLSRGKEEFVQYLIDLGYITDNNSKISAHKIPLFIFDGSDKISRNDDCHKEFLSAFYSIKRFKDQTIKHTEPFKRKDILKLVFWNYAYDSNYSRGDRANVRKSMFKRYFNGDTGNEKWDTMIKRTQVANINEDNSLDCLLILCAEHDDPVAFLEKAYEEYGSSLKKIL